MIKLCIYTTDHEPDENCPAEWEELTPRWLDPDSHGYMRYPCSACYGQPEDLESDYERYGNSAGGREYLLRQLRRGRTLTQLSREDRRYVHRAVRFAGEAANGGRLERRQSFERRRPSASHVSASTASRADTSTSVSMTTFTDATDDTETDRRGGTRDRAPGNAGRVDWGSLNGAH